MSTFSHRSAVTLAAYVRNDTRYIDVTTSRSELYLFQTRWRCSITPIPSWSVWPVESRDPTAFARAQCLRQTASLGNRGCVYFPSDLETFLLQNGPVAKSQGAITETYLNFLYLDDKLMDLPNDLAVKTLLLEKTCDLERQFGEKYLVIWTSKRPAKSSLHARTPPSSTFAILMVTVLSC